MTRKRKNQLHKWVYSLWEYEVRLATWAQTGGWGARFIPVPITEDQFDGLYRVPGLVLSREKDTFVFEPKVRFQSSGKGGLVYFRRMSEHDGISVLILRKNRLFLLQETDKNPKGHTVPLTLGEFMALLCPGAY